MEKSLSMLESLLTELPQLVNGFDESAFFRKPAAKKWSKQEILGHLCDSAANNHVRFVRIMTSDEPIAIDGYQQDEWVRLHDYQHRYSRSELIDLWVALNVQIRNVMQSASQLDRNKRCLLNDGSQFTLLELFEDYMNHLQHHLGQIRENEVEGER